MRVSKHLWVLYLLSSFSHAETNHDLLEVMPRLKGPVVRTEQLAAAIKPPTSTCLCEYNPDCKVPKGTVGKENYCRKNCEEWAQKTKAAQGCTTVIKPIVEYPNPDPYKLEKGACSTLYYHSAMYAADGLRHAKHFLDQCGGKKVVTSTSACRSMIHSFNDKETTYNSVNPFTEMSEVKKAMREYFADDVEVSVEGKQTCDPKTIIKLSQKKGVQSEETALICSDLDRNRVACVSWFHAQAVSCRNESKPGTPTGARKCCDSGLNKGLTWQSVDDFCPVRYSGGGAPFGFFGIGQ